MPVIMSHCHECNATRVMNPLKLGGHRCTGCGKTKAAVAAILYAASVEPKKRRTSAKDQKQKEKEKGRK